MVKIPVFELDRTSRQYLWIHIFLGLIYNEQLFWQSLLYFWVEIKIKPHLKSCQYPLINYSAKKQREKWNQKDQSEWAFRRMEKRLEEPVSVWHFKLRLVHGQILRYRLYLQPFSYCCNNLPIKLVAQWTFFQLRSTLPRIFDSIEEER